MTPQYSMRASHESKLERVLNLGWGLGAGGVVFGMFQGVFSDTWPLGAVLLGGGLVVLVITLLVSWVTGRLKH